MAGISEEMVEEYTKWYRIAGEEMDDPELVGKRSKDRIVEDDLISQKNQPWMMISPQGKDAEYMKNESENPNVWFRLNEDSITMGLGFNQVAKVDKFKRVMNDLNQDAREELERALDNLGQDWNVTVEQRWKSYFQGEQKLREGYNQEFEIEEVRKNIEDVVDMVNEWREEGKRRAENDDVSEEKPVVNMPRTTFEKSEEEFRKRLKEIFPVYEAVVDVKTKSQIKKETREMEKRLEVLRDKEESREERVKQLQKRIDADPPEKMLEARKQEKEQKEEELREIREEIDRIEEKLRGTG